MPRCQIFRHATPTFAGPCAGCDHTAALLPNQAFIADMAAFTGLRYIAESALPQKPDN